MIAAFDAPDYARAVADFRWPRPQRFNLAEVMLDHWATWEPTRTALYEIAETGETHAWSYAQLSAAANQFANAVEGLGLGRGARCGVLLPQSAAAAIAHLGLYKIGRVALPLFTLFGEDGLQFRLENAGAEVVVTDAANLPKLLAIRDVLPALRTILCTDGPREGALGFWETLASARDQRETLATGPLDPAFICYTSGTTGPPKGALHGHKALIGHLPGVQMWLQGVPKPQDVAWTPADWAWLGGLCNMLMPSLYYGIPIVAHRMGKFDPERAYWILRRFKVTVSFMPPTALKLMRQASALDTRGLSLRAVGCGGEPLGEQLLAWGRETLDLTINEFYGQTECNLIVTNNAEMMAVKPGSMGRPTPGAEIAVLGSDGQVLPAGEAGEIAVRRPHPAMFLEYWKRPDATAAKFAGDWMRTGDEGVIDDEGYVSFAARADDVISSAGYRIGPGEIEDCLSAHAAVAMAGVIGVPDALRGEAVKAYVVLRPGWRAEGDLVAALQAHVKTRLGPHEYPREVAFIQSLPMTATGKIMRRELKRLHAESQSAERGSLDG